MIKKQGVQDEGKEITTHPHLEFLYFLEYDIRIKRNHNAKELYRKNVFAQINRFFKRGLKIKIYQTLVFPMIAFQPTEKYGRINRRAVVIVLLRLSSTLVYQIEGGVGKEGGGVQWRVVFGAKGARAPLVFLEKKYSRKIHHSIHMAYYMCFIKIKKKH